MILRVVDGIPGDDEKCSFCGVNQAVVYAVDDQAGDPPRPVCHGCLPPGSFDQIMAAHLNLR